MVTQLATCDMFPGGGRNRIFWKNPISEHPATCRLSVFRSDLLIFGMGGKLG